MSWLSDALNAMWSSANDETVNVAVEIGLAAMRRAVRDGTVEDYPVHSLRSAMNGIEAAVMSTFRNPVKTLVQDKVRRLLNRRLILWHYRKAYNATN
jgi:hypothetical protein